jgi:hypothetical protein
MSEPDRPPLDPRVYDLIELTLYKADQRHWDQLAPMQVAPVVGFPKSLPPPKLRALLLNRLEVYAGELFKLEADQYSEFKNRAEYPAWLSRLADRVIARVFSRVEILERANKPATLAYHGLTDDEVRASLSKELWEIGTYYTWKDSSPQVPAEAANTQPRVELSPRIETSPKLSERIALFDSYRSSFPDAGIMDICWAAKQHYREWARWLKDELKDGSKPDRAFRFVLSAGKTPSELRREQRPKGWK